jgi:hypothetical protein
MPKRTRSLKKILTSYEAERVDQIARWKSQPPRRGAYSAMYHAALAAVFPFFAARSFLSGRGGIRKEDGHKQLDVRQGRALPSKTGGEELPAASSA